MKIYQSRSFEKKIKKFLKDEKDIENKIKNRRP
jgi:hypothetical protein